MGIDYGTKKVGVALSDESGKMAFPHSVIKRDGELVKALTELAEANDVRFIVLGYSLSGDGKPNSLHAEVEELMGDLTLALGVPIHLEPEQYTTQAAIRLQGRNDKTDASAATLILNSYLEKNKT